MIKITPLGTISPYQKDNMNCPGYLVEYKDNKILLDCGNGVTRLLNFPNVLKNLNVRVTHYHIDHFGDKGLIQYASYVYHNLGLLNKRINIYLPKNDYLYRKKSIILNKESYSNYIDINDNYTFNVDDLNVTFYNNKSHNIESFIVKLQNKDYKIIYTSDIGTNNFDELVKICKDCDLLICESSLLKKHNSNNKTHMTSFDASILAKKTNTKKLLLTHFWPEEDKNLYLEEAKLNFDNAEVAMEGKKLILNRGEK